MTHVAMWAESWKSHGGDLCPRPFPLFAGMPAGRYHGRDGPLRVRRARCAVPWAMWGKMWEKGAMRRAVLSIAAERIPWERRQRVPPGTAMRRGGYFGETRDWGAEAVMPVLSVTLQSSKEPAP